MFDFGIAFDIAKGPGLCVIEQLVETSNLQCIGEAP